MKRLIIILTLTLFSLHPAIELSAGWQCGSVWCSIQAKNKKPKRLGKISSTKKNRKTKKKQSTLNTVPHITSLTTKSVAPNEKAWLTVNVPKGNERIDYKAITIYFNQALRIPVCVAYNLTATMVSMADAPTAEKRKSYKFHCDPKVAQCPDWGDYRNSGYTRGHMAPAMDMRWDKQAMSECFLMTNMCPQDGDLNNGPWRQLEESVHRWAKRDGNIIVYTGPIMSSNPPHIGPKGDISVPSSFYKVLYAPAQHRAIAFIFKNAPKQGSMKNHATTIADVERRTGITFFPKMATREARELKQQCELAQWQ